MAKPMTAAQIKAAFNKWDVDASYLDGFEKRGRPASTAGGPFADVKGIIVHHTASESQTNDYVNFLFKVGRADLPAPLCQFATNKKGLTYVGALGKANHAGLGSKSVHNYVVNENYDGYNKELKGGNSFNGNAFYYGNEVMYRGVDGYKMTDAQYAAVIRFCAAICDHYGWTALSVIGHREWSSTKIDPGYAPMNKVRKDVQALLDGKKPAPVVPEKPVEVPVPKPAEPNTLKHTVVRGETLYSISKRYNVTVEELKAWNNFKSDIIIPGETIVVKATVETIPTPPAVPKVYDKMDPASYFKGVEGDHVTWLGTRLTLHGFGGSYVVGPGPNWGEADRRAVEAFQKAQGWSGSDADGYPGKQTLALLAKEPAEQNVGPRTRINSYNVAAYDKKKGEANRISRIPKVAKRAKQGSPTFIAFQELSSDMLAKMDKELSGYSRVPAGGKGREIYYHKSRGIKILGAELGNVHHMLAKDTKEFVMLAYERFGHKGVLTSFHNENEGVTYQKLQTQDVLKATLAFAKKHGVKEENIVLAGDSNRKNTAADVKAWGKRAADSIAKKLHKTAYESTNGWVGRVKLGSRIDWFIVDDKADIEIVEQYIENYNTESDHYEQSMIIVLQ